MAHCISLLEMVLNVEVVSTSSVGVSLNDIDIPEITGYYSQTRNRRSEELSVTVPSSVNSVVIGNLVSNVEYQFQVAAIAELDGVVFPGVRSIITAKVVALSRDVYEVWRKVEKGQCMRKLMPKT